MARPRMSQMTPDQLDPLDAAATPIAPDPRVGPVRWGQPEIDAHVQATVGAAANDDEAHQVLMAQLMEQGYSRDEAAQIAGRDMARAQFERNRGGPISDGLRQRMERQDQFAEDYDAATGGPAARAELDAVRNPGVDAGTAFGNMANAAKNRANVEWQAYLRRQAEKLPRPGVFHDQAVQEQETYGDGLPPGSSLSLFQQAARNHRDEVEDRERADPYRQRQQLRRMSIDSGIPYEDLAKMTPEDRIVAVGTARDKKAAADYDKRKSTWQAQMMLAGSNPARNAANAFDMLGDPEVSDWQKAVLASRFAPELHGVTPLGVDAAHNAQLTQLGLRVAQGKGFRDDMPPGIQAANEAKATAGLTPAEQIPIHKDRPGIHPSELKYADDYVAQHYSSGGGLLGISSEFTLAEQQQVIDHLVNDMGYTPAKAQKIVDEVARRRDRGSYWGSPVRGAPAGDPPVLPDPAPAAPAKPAGSRMPL